jgi:hypothetical protein
MFIKLKTLVRQNEGLPMRHFRMLLTGLFLLAAFFWNGPAARGGAGAAAENRQGTAKERPGFAERILSVYRDHISAVDGDRCPSYPTCSSYSVQAFKKHGFVMGWLMTVDRLIHEGSEEAAISPRILSDGELRIYDPVENNDFWWHRPEQKDHEQK